MRASDIVIGLFIFSAVVMGMGQFFARTAEGYSFSAPSIASYNNTTAMSVMTDSMASSLKSGQVLSDDPAFVILSTAWNAITMPFQAIGTVASSLYRFAQDVPAAMPDWLIGIIMGILTFTIIMSIINVATKGNL